MTGSERCSRCAAGDFTRTRRDDGLRHRATTTPPTIEQLEEWNSECGCEATDGCWCEPDGTCEHGHVSWLLQLHLI